MGKQQGRYKKTKRGYNYDLRVGEFVHRIVMTTKINRPLKPKEVVHHINKDKLDNRPENLRLFTNQEKHNFHHWWQAIVFGKDYSYSGKVTLRFFSPFVLLGLMLALVPWSRSKDLAGDSA